MFPTLPPITVALWERHLAYGAAFGVAPAAARPVAMGAESDHRAWSSYGGRWRAVRVRYPHLVPPGWGLHPGLAIFRSVLAGAPAVFVLWVVAPAVFDAAPDLGIVIALLFVGVPAVVAIAAAATILRAAADLWRTTDVTGQILRLRVYGGDDDKRHYVAVDADGTAEKIRAWRVKSDLYSTLVQDEVVTATLTPNLRYVRSIEPAPSRNRSNESESGAIRSGENV